VTEPQQPMVAGQRDADEAERDDDSGGRDRAEDEEHHHRLCEHSLHWRYTGEDEPGHGTWQEHQAGGFGGFDLWGHRRPQRNPEVWSGGLARRLPEGLASPVGSGRKLSEYDIGIRVGG